MTLGELLDFDDWDDWDRWLRRRHKKKNGKLAKSAIEKAYRVFNTFLNFALEKQLLPYNPRSNRYSARGAGPTAKLARRHRRRSRPARSCAATEDQAPRAGPALDSRPVPARAADAARAPHGSDLGWAAAR